MITIFEKHEIINLKERGVSNREVSKIINLDRKTVAMVWNKHLQLLKDLDKSSNAEETRRIQQEIVVSPSYVTSVRMQRKFTIEMENIIDELLEKEKHKDINLGTNHKQQLTYSIIHEILLEKGFDISLTTISKVVREKRKKIKNFCYAQYNYGNRLEFDFGEVKLFINGTYQSCYIAVLSSPASNFRMAYLYKTQCKKFLWMHM